MHLFYEEEGSFKVGTVLSETEASYQVEAPHGKRSKIKAAAVLVRFSQPPPAELLARAEAAAAEIDLDFLWEVAPQEEFDAQSLGREYYGHDPAPVETAALLLRLHGAPMYFYRRGKGRYKPAPEDALRAALVAIERKKQQAVVQAALVEEMMQGRLPEPIAANAWQLLLKPDKNGIEWKAVDAACTATHQSPPRLMLALGALRSAYDFHWKRFVSEHFARGTGFAPTAVPAVTRQLPLADVQAFSIDDSMTTEIDDAFSVVNLDGGLVRVGIHIAAPALAISRDSALDVIARSRMSTVYYPGGKITMLPPPCIEGFTLAAGRSCPALSLYVTTRRGDWEILSHESRVEMVPVTENLRHDELEASVTEESLADPGAAFPRKEELCTLWEFARSLSAGRDAVRGKPESNNRVDYTFKIHPKPFDAEPFDANAVQVQIVPRRRNSPLDRLVAEFMILANSVWGGLLAQSGVPGIYRSQQAGKVRMSTHPAPHDSIGVSQYAWCTSPLRRYVDLVNQMQLVACIDFGVAAPLKAPFKPRDADLFAIIGAFDAQYAAWSEFQDAMERYWCLRWLQQESVGRVEASVIRDELVRIAGLPLFVRIAGLAGLARGTHVEVDIGEIDTLELDVRAHFAMSAQPAATGDQDDGDSDAEDVLEETVD